MIERPMVLGIRNVTACKLTLPIRYIGRGSMHGNPYVVTAHGRYTSDGSREVCLVKFAEYAEARARKEPEWLHSLAGQHLLCFCKPQHKCHGDWFIERLYGRKK